LVDFDVSDAGETLPKRAAAVGLFEAARYRDRADSKESHQSVDRAAGEARPGVSGTVARVGENGVGSRSLFDDRGSGAVCDRPFDRLLTVNR